MSNELSLKKSLLKKRFSYFVDTVDVFSQNYVDGLNESEVDEFLNYIYSLDTNFRKVMDLRDIGARLIKEKKDD